MIRKNSSPKNPEKNAEPEGGPGERMRQFLEERITPLAPKGTPPPPTPVTPEESGQPPSEEPPLPSDFRPQLIQQYRQRQQAQMQPPPRPEPGTEMPPPPEPPQLIDDNYSWRSTTIRVEVRRQL